VDCTVTRRALESGCAHHLSISNLSYQHRAQDDRPMGTVRAPIPQVQKLLAPLLEREQSITKQIDELDTLLLQRRSELTALQGEIKSLTDWVPPTALTNLYTEGRLKARAQTDEVENAAEGDENEEDDFFYDCEEEEEEEPAPAQPDDPLNASAANEDQRTFNVLNAAMAVLRQEHADRVQESASGKRKMSLLDRCFFDVRDYMGRLVDSLPPADSTRERVPADVAASGIKDLYQPHLIAGGSTQMVVQTQPAPSNRILKMPQPSYIPET